MKFGQTKEIKRALGELEELFDKISTLPRKSHRIVSNICNSLIYSLNENLTNTLSLLREIIPPQFEETRSVIVLKDPNIYRASLPCLSTPIEQPIIQHGPLLRSLRLHKLGSSFPSRPLCISGQGRGLAYTHNSSLVVTLDGVPIKEILLKPPFSLLHSDMKGNIFFLQSDELFLLRSQDSSPLFLTQVASCYEDPILLTEPSSNLTVLVQNGLTFFKPGEGGICVSSGQGINDVFGKFFVFMNANTNNQLHGFPEPSCSSKRYILVGINEYGDYYTYIIDQEFKVTQVSSGRLDAIEGCRITTVELLETAQQILVSKYTRSKSVLGYKQSIVAYSILDFTNIKLLASVDLPYERFNSLEVVKQTVACQDRKTLYYYCYVVTNKGRIGLYLIAAERAEIVQISKFSSQNQKNCTVFITGNILCSSEWIKSREVWSTVPLRML